MCSSLARPNAVIRSERSILERSCPVSLRRPLSSVFVTYPFSLGSMKFHASTSLKDGSLASRTRDNSSSLSSSSCFVNTLASTDSIPLNFSGSFAEGEDALISELTSPSVLLPSLLLVREAPLCTSIWTWVILVPSSGPSPNRMLMFIFMFVGAAVLSLSMCEVLSCCRRLCLESMSVPSLPSSSSSSSASSSQSAKSPKFFVV
mmetsp:Transcript_20813/g.29008  ORF Transcript_20813/g.29008 Transcript_20813/m.29008 type:complete len:204 (-) Transcript_20813:50-661(-)